MESRRQRQVGQAGVRALGGAGLAGLHCPGTGGSARDRHWRAGQCCVPLEEVFGPYTHNG